MQNNGTIEVRLRKKAQVCIKFKVSSCFGILIIAVTSGSELIFFNSIF